MLIHGILNAYTIEIAFLIYKNKLPTIFVSDDTDVSPNLASTAIYKLT